MEPIEDQDTSKSTSNGQGAVMWAVAVIGDKASPADVADVAGMSEAAARNSLYRCYNDGYLSREKGYNGVYEYDINGVESVSEGNLPGRVTAEELRYDRYIGTTVKDVTVTIRASESDSGGRQFDADEKVILMQNPVTRAIETVRENVNDD